MLLKYTQAQKRIKSTGIGKPQRTAGGMVKLTSGLMTVVPKIHRKVIKVASKRPASVLRAAVKREQIPVDPCDNSNDSGLGFDHHLDYHPPLATHSALCFSDKEAAWQAEESSEVKRRRLEIKLESDDANDNFTFPETVRQQPSRPICLPVRGRGRVLVPLTLSSQLPTSSHNGLAQLLIVCQPEQQHRARYQTEGSRGAVKDRTGNGFPVVKLVGYDRPATLQVFIGTDQGRVAPHMFYQACRVSGKNSTPCAEKKIDGTIVIEVDFEPSKEMVVTCDCVGILKERNVDVEHRFPEEGSGRSKKKSTRCRMVFRTAITHPDGSQETLQVTSQPIVCTQPPGVPEICKKSLSSCSVRGGQELFILGKNFLKDTRVVFQEGEGGSGAWSQSVQPDKEFLQQSHLVCMVPPYHTNDITEPVTVRLVVESSGKASEPHSLLYLPDNGPVLVPEGNMANNSVVSHGGSTAVYSSHLAVPPPLLLTSEPAPSFMPTLTSSGAEEKVHPVLIWEKPAEVMMPPPPPAMPMQITMRRSSVQMIVPEPLGPEELKRETPETIMEMPKPLAHVSDLSGTHPPSLDTFHRFVTVNNALPSINVSTYLSSLEGNSIYADKGDKGQLKNELPRIVIPSPPSNKNIFAGDSSNLLTTVEPVLVNESSTTRAFDARNMTVNSTASQPSQEALSVIVSSSMMQKKSLESHIAADVQHHKQLTDSQNVRMDLLMPPGMNNRAPTMTERLDAFVNSAAESHISPTPTSPITMTSVITENSVLNPLNNIVVNGTNNINKLPESNIPPMMQSSPLPISPHSSPPLGTTSMDNGSVCSLMNSTVDVSPHTSSNHTQVVSTIQASLGHHINNQNENMVQDNLNIMQSPSQVSINQAEAFSNLQASIEQQLSNQSAASQMSNLQTSIEQQLSNQSATSQISNLQASLEQQLSNQSAASQMSNLQASLEQQLSNQSAASQVSNLQASLEQRLSNQSAASQISNLQASLEQQLSNQSSPQRSPSQAQTITNLHVALEQQVSPQTVGSPQMIHPNLNDLMSSSQNSTNQSQSLSNLQASLEQQMSSQTMSSAQINHSDLNTIMQSPPQSSMRESMSTLQTSLEHHLSSQSLNTSQMIHSEPVQHSNLSVNNMGNIMQTTTQSSSEMQNLSNLQASLERHLSSQVIDSVQNIPESLSNGTITMDSLNSSVPTSTQIQAAVNQVQALSNLQASLEHHLSSQVIGSSQSMNQHESTTPVGHSPNGLDTRLEASPQVTASQAQTLKNLQMTLGHLNSQVLTSQPSHESMTGDLSLNGSVQTTSQVQVAVSQQEVLSNYQASLEQLSSGNISRRASSESMMPLERLSSSLSCTQQSTDHNLSSLQASINHLSSQVLTSAHSPHSESFTSNNSSQTIDLTNPMSLMSSQPMSIASNASSSSSPVMLMSPNSLHSPTSVLSPPGVSMNSTPTMTLSPTMSLSPQNLTVHTSQPMEISSSSMVLTSSLALNNPPLSLTQTNMQMQPNSISQFDQNISQNLPVQVSSMNHYDQSQEMLSTNKESDRKDPPPYLMQPSSTAVGQQQNNFEMKPAAAAQIPVVKKCEEGMPLPNELTQMSEHDLISYINPSCFDAV